MFTSELRTITTSEINKQSFDCGLVVTPKRKLSFFDGKTGNKLTANDLYEYDKSTMKNKGFGVWASVCPEVNITNWDHDNQCHFVSVLESHHCPVTGWYYCVNSYETSFSKLGKPIKRKGFTTIKALKEYINDNQDRL